MTIWEKAVAEFGVVDTRGYYKMKLAEKRVYAVRLGATEEQVAKLKGIYLRWLVNDLQKAKFEELTSRYK